MTLGAWIFLSVLLLLVVLHKQFRKFFFWTAGIAAVCFGIFAGYSYLKERLKERREAAEQAAYLKRVDKCVTRLTDAFHLPPGYTDPRYSDGSTPASVCSLSPDITQDDAMAQHSPPQIDWSQYAAQPTAKKKAMAGPKSWAVVASDFVGVYSRCHFEAGNKQYDSNACGVFDKETIAELKKGDRVGILSGVVRSSGGTNIYQVKFQKWTGWVKTADLTVEEDR